MSEPAWVPLHAHSNFSILDGFGEPKKHVTRAKSLGLPALAITDHGTCAGHVQHLQACQKAGIKPLLGVELYVSINNAAIKSNDNRFHHHMVVLAKNRQGWHDLNKLISAASSGQYFYYKPRIHIFDTTLDGNTCYGIEHYVKNGNIIGLSGHQGSLLCDNLFVDLVNTPPKEVKQILKQAYQRVDKEVDHKFFEKFLQPNWFDSTVSLAQRLRGVFGKDNFFIELQNEYHHEKSLGLQIHPFVVEKLRLVAKETGILTVPTGDSHYPSQEDAQDQRIMVMTSLNTTEASVEQSKEEGEDTLAFFHCSSFYMHSYEEMSRVFTTEELANTVKVADSIEEYDITTQPNVPKFVTPEIHDAEYMDQCSDDSERYLVHLCVEGAKRLHPWTHTGHTKSEYWKRLRDELAILFEAKLADYFLVVWDMCMAADYRPADESYDWQANIKNNKSVKPIPRGVGRGSAAGCLVSYLTGITNIDPLAYGLIFSRFYNPSRNQCAYMNFDQCSYERWITGETGA